MKSKLFLILSAALVLALPARAVVILVDTWASPNSGDASENAAAQAGINEWNANNPLSPYFPLPNLFNSATTPPPPTLLADWNTVVGKSSADTNAELIALGVITAGDEKTINWTAPLTYAEYYVLTKWGQGQANFDTALHYVTAGSLLSYNPGGSSAPNGLSHLVVWGKGSTDIPGVPDSGATIALLGLSLVAAGAFRRFLS